MNEKLKQLILEILKFHNGTTETAVEMNIMTRIGPSNFAHLEFIEAIAGLLIEGKVKRLILTDPPDSASPSRSKTLLFAKNTVFMNLSELIDDRELSILANKGN